MTSLCRCCTLCKNGDWLQLARWHQRRTFVPVVQPLLLPWRFLICYADTGIDLGEDGGGSHGVNDAALQPCYGVTVRVGKTRCGAADKFFLLLLIHVTNIVHRSVESKVYLLR